MCYLGGMTSAIPARVRRLASARALARESGNYVEADALRDELVELGWQVLDTSEGFELIELPTFERVNLASLKEVWSDPPTKRVSVLVSYEGYPSDLARFILGMGRHHDLAEVEILVVDPDSSDGDVVAEITRDIPSCRAIHLSSDPGWAAIRNACIRAASGDAIVLADLSIEPTGDMLTPLLSSLEKPDVAVTGPIGIVTVDLREWEEAATPTCDAIEGYLMAAKRDLFREAGPLDERFTWYRNADLAFSMQLREVAGGSAIITEIPFKRHEHRGYSRYPDEAERDRQSRRNYNLFLDRWRDAKHLLTGAPSKG